MEARTSIPGSCIAALQWCLYVIAAINILMALTLVLVSINVKGPGAHGAADYFCCFIFFVTAALAIAASAQPKTSLAWSLIAITVTRCFTSFVNSSKKQFRNFVRPIFQRH
ncbi:unnamed protein product [Gongylonema pulchrum]|uniref:G_PROTEIN_RECEP_F1_2 domain-containing protein n=1 Tax=Gongylonema pulchrum TaxID=637853 RepID=A0A183DDL0_9BILA|nr:unnamed protein product [Gongylonema pulchrum]